MQSPIIKIDTLKPIGTLVDLTGQFNARVGDAYTPITIQWTEGGNAKNLDGLHPVFEAVVGQGHIENNEVLMNDDAVPVRWVGDQSSIRGYDQTILKLPPQVFSKSGLCYGYLALENDQGVRETSVDIWFKVLGGVYNMGLACNYFITDFQKALAKAKGDVFQALDEIKKNYELKIQSAENAIDDNVAALKNLKGSVGAIQAQIDAGNVVTLTKHNTDIDRISKAIEDKLAQMDLQPEAFENEAALKSKYPNGAVGLMLTVDTGHKWVWINGAWKDCGVYQSAGLNPETRRRLTYLDASDSITKQALQTMTDQVVDLQWFVGSIDINTGAITPKDRSMSAYSSLKVLGKSYTFKFDFDSKVLPFIAIIEFDSGGKILAHHNAAAGGMYAPSAEASAVRFEIVQPTGTMGQNDLRNVIHDSKLKITDYGARSLVNDVNNLYLSEHLLPLMATQGKTINTNVDYGEEVDVTKLNDVPAYQVVNKTCQAGDVFILTNLQGGSNALGWAFLNQKGQLLQKSLTGIETDLITLYAPNDAYKLIVNSSLSNFAAYQYYPDATRLADINIAQTANVNCNIKLAFQPGETVSLYPEAVGGYKYEVLSCKAGDEFKICGFGGVSPRLYAFLTADNHLITVAKPYLNASTGLYIKAPALAKKLVVNFNTSDGNPVELYKVPNGTVNQQSEQFKQLATPPVDVRMASYLNGIKLGKGLSTHLADFAKEGDKMVHVSTFYKVGDALYMSYYANTRTNAEDPTKHTARLVYAPFDNLSQQTYIDVADIGQEYNGQTIDAIYDSLLLKTSDDSYMIYAFTAKVGGKFYMLYRRFDPKTKLLSDIHTMNFKVGAMTSTFDTVSVHDLLAKAGIDYDYEDRDISFIQKLSPRIEDGVVQYYAGIGILHFCFVVKSSDLINWTFVSTPDFMYKPEFEPSVYVKGDNVYYFCRQRGTEGNAVLAKYNIPNDQWSNPILVPDTQSRYDFFENNSQLYLVHSPLDRNHISLMQIDQNVLAKSREVATAEVQDCFYPFTQNIDGQMYMSFTQSRHHIWLNKFSPVYYSNDDVINLFNKLTG